MRFLCRSNFGRLGFNLFEIGDFGLWFFFFLFLSYFDLFRWLNLILKLWATFLLYFKFIYLWSLFLSFKNFDRLLGWSLDWSWALIVFRLFVAILLWFQRGTKNFFFKKCFYINLVLIFRWSVNLTNGINVSTIIHFRKFSFFSYFLNVEFFVKKINTYFDRFLAKHGVLTRFWKI